MNYQVLKRIRNSCQDVILTEKHLSSFVNQETRRHGYLPPRDDSVESPAGKFLVEASEALQRPPRSLGSLRLKLLAYALPFFSFLFAFSLLSTFDSGLSIPIAHAQSASSQFTTSIKTVGVDT